MNKKNGENIMKLLKMLACFAVFSVVLVCGCKWLYDDGETESGVEVAAAETLEEQSEEVTESSLVTMPITQLETGALPEYTTISFSFMGDCILSSNAGDAREDSFRQYAEKKPASYFFEKAAPYYSESDFVMANSEFVLSDDTLAKTSKEGRAFWFRSPVRYTDIFKSGGIDIVTLANNHTLDYGQDGYKSTKDALDEAGIKWGDLENPVYVKKNGITFGIICTKLYNTDFKPVVSPVIEEVKANSDIQILFFHGGTEGEHTPDDWLRELCHDFADMGVDLIIGSHPHVLRPMEEYNGVDIFYSLGNFCYGANRLPENRTVLVTETFTFDEDGTYISCEEKITPFYVYTGAHNNWQPSPVTDPMEISRTLSFMYGHSTSPQ